MGGGNAQKSATARAKNAEKAAAEAKGGGGSAGQKARTSQPSYTCKVTYKTFPATQRKAAEQHVQDKCPGKTFEQCFPDWK
mmetsp:Transcript_46048/g.104933  ORF Transcript_46048/g.104933 Transcript_46048/m.104933 type:complete len:81 (-) Transcript_46048:207-449(-)